VGQAFERSGRGALVVTDRHHVLRGGCRVEPIVVVLLHARESTRSPAAT
jgi:hypothetical protein